MHAHFAEGRAHLEGALARPMQPSALLAEALLGAGRIASCQNDLASAESRLRQSEALARKLDIPEILWQAIFERGNVAEWQGDDVRAVLHNEAALVIARNLVALEDAYGYRIIAKHPTIDHDTALELILASARLATGHALTSS